MGILDGKRQFFSKLVVFDWNQVYFILNGNFRFQKRHLFNLNLLIMMKKWVFLVGELLFSAIN